MIKLFLLSIAMSGFLVSCSSVNRYFGMEDDNIVEEIGETVIKTETGLDMDLTPSTPEK